MVTRGLTMMRPERQRGIVVFTADIRSRRHMSTVPDPTKVHWPEKIESTAFPKPLVTSPEIEVGDFTYYNDADELASAGIRNVPPAAGPKELLGRVPERAVLGRLLAGVRAGRSGVLVLRGEAGVGRTALLEEAIGSAAGFRVVRVAGVESEMELAFGALQQVCAPLLDLLGVLPDPQREALGVAFGLAAGAAPDRFLVGLAALSLLSEAAERQPLLCVVDDAQWLDRASAQALGFVARRLLAEPVALVAATREAGGEFGGLPELPVGGLGEADARALLGSVIGGPLDEQVRDRIVAETRGNPLALLELPRGVTPAELAGGFGLPGAGLPGAAGVAGRIEDSFRRRLEDLPAAAQRLVLVAAAEPAGEPVLVWAAAQRLGAGAGAIAAAADAGLLVIGQRVVFRHPLVRSAAYRAASPPERRAVHAALAAVTDPRADPDRRAWHRAQATVGPDEQVAAELERSAGRAQARGGLAAAAAFLGRSAALTVDPARRAERALAAAQATCQAGAFEAALDLLATAEAGPPDRFRRARAGLLRGQIAFASGHGRDAPPLLLQAARQLEPLDSRLARETYLDAVAAATFAGRLAAGGGIREVAEAARAAPPAPGPARAMDLLLDGLALLATEGYPAGAPVLRQAVSAFGAADLPAPEGLRWLWLACRAAQTVGDDASWDELSARQLTLAREAGALTALPMACNMRSGAHVVAGDFTEAAAMVAQADSFTEVTGTSLAPYGALTLAVYRGRETQATQLIQTATEDAERRGEGAALTFVQWAQAVLYNSLGRYDQALAAAQQASDDSPAVRFASWALVELVEAAVRTAVPERAAGALQRLSGIARACGTDWALGIEARSWALASDGQDAEDLYREAIGRFGRTRLRVERGRAHLVYGEWLRRRRRQRDARDQLAQAYQIFHSAGAAAFAERARIELRASGGQAREHAVATRDPLTAQEAVIARLAGEGASNPEIAAQLFISRATVAYHLRKVFTKLAISSRSQLTDALPARHGTTPPVTPQH
jgi:DNA-binding CsgD family transcriptional regulator